MNVVVYRTEEMHSSDASVHLGIVAAATVVVVVAFEFVAIVAVVDAPVAVVVVVVVREYVKFAAVTADYD